MQSPIWRLTRFFNVPGRFVFAFLFALMASSIGVGQSVKLNGSNQYGNAGNGANLHLTDFTLEAWIKIDGTGVTASSGSGGLASAIPIITKGRGEVDGTPSKEVNFFFGYQPSNNKLVADFEDNATAGNHPVTGNATLSSCAWTHIACTFSVSAKTWKLYINGVLDKTLSLGTTTITPQSLSNVNTGIGTSFNSTGAAGGFFNGRIDEVRIWNTVRTDAEILANFNIELSTGTGLVSRWGLNEGSGNTTANAIAGGTAISFSGSPAWSTGFSQTANDKAYLQFDGSNDYVNFGQYLASGAGGALTKGTIEFWFKARTLDANDQYLISLTKSGSYDGELRCYIDAPTNNLVFTIECTGPTATYTVKSGTGPISAGVWYHVALVWQSDATASMKMYLNGVQAGSSLTPTCGMQISDQSLNLGRNNSSTTNTYFDGNIDELRIWNIVRSATDIQSNMNEELTSGTGLRGRWGFNTTCGTTAANSISGGLSGTLVNGVVWVGGSATPPPPVNNPPNAPSNPSPANNSAAASANPDICATVSDPQGGTLRARFYGRKKATAATGQKFTVVILPDTQYYTAEPQGTSGGNNAMFKAQTKWLVDNRQLLNIVYVGQLGDCTNNGDDPPGSDNTIEWRRADTAIKAIENPATTGLAEGIPYGISVGNHDQSPNGSAAGTTNYYNQFFGAARFAGRSYYGGHYGANNDNFYDSFSASGVNFLVISMEYNTTPDAAVLDWAANLCQTYSTKKVIVMTHYGIDESTAFGTQGAAIYNKLKVYPNFILFACGHIHQSDGEARRSDVYNGNTVNTLLSDYQGRAGGGNGLLRIYQFDPSANKLSVKTYSPYLGTYETDADSQFDLDISLTNTPPAENYTLIGEVPAASSGTNACANWPNLLPQTNYEWYVELYDGVNTTVGPTWNFVTPGTALRVDPSNVVAKKMTTGADLIQKESRIYPNPATGNSFIVQLGDAYLGNVNISIYDMNGRLQSRREYGGQKTILINHSLRPGMYIVRIQSDHTLENKKLIIQ